MEAGVRLRCRLELGLELAIVLGMGVRLGCRLLLECTGGVAIGVLLNGLRIGALVASVLGLVDVDDDDGVVLLDFAVLRRRGVCGAVRDVTLIDVMSRSSCLVQTRLLVVANVNFAAGLA